MGGAGKSTYFLTVFLEMPSCLAMPLRETPCSLAGLCTLKPESTDGRREGWASWDEGAYKGETLASIGTDVSRQRVFSSRAEPRERSMDVGNRVIVEIGHNRMHSRTGRTRVWRRWAGGG